MPNPDDPTSPIDGKANGPASTSPTPDQQQQLPALSIAGVEHWGVAPEGTNVLAIVTTETGQRVRLFMTFDALSDLLPVLRSARNQAMVNQAQARSDGAEPICAERADTFKVGHTAELDGVLLVINPDCNDQATFAFDSASAMRCAQQLANEAQQRMHVEGRLTKAVRDTNDPTKRRLILPAGFAQPRRPH